MLLCPTQAQAAQGAKTFSSCVAVWNVYDTGIARTSAAARAAQREGYAYPTVSRKTYNANWRRLDSNRTGILCGVLGMSYSEQKVDFIFSPEDHTCRRLYGDVPTNQWAASCARLKEAFVLSPMNLMCPRLYGNLPIIQWDANCTKLDGAVSDDWPTIVMCRRLHAGPIIKWPDSCFQ